MKAAIFGAGNIGRGFIGALFSGSGCEVTFIDVAKPVIERMNADRQYPVNIVSGDNSREIIIKNVCAVDANDTDAAANAIAEADIVTTCVGAKAIKFIIANLAEGVRRRLAATGKPLNLLICENLMDADKYIHSLLEDVLTPEELGNVGLIETSVGRMVPVPRPEMQTDNPLRISVEEYGVLPVDSAAFKGEIPEIKNMVPFSPFHYYIERKLFIHNMGHAICAYLGEMLGMEYIYQGIGTPEIRVIVQSAMTESAVALAAKYGTPTAPVISHVFDLIRRFGNAALGDTCARVGADIPRKLANSDRLIGAALNVIESGEVPAYISAGCAAATVRYLEQNQMELTVDNAREQLCALSGLEADHAIVNYAMEYVPILASGADLAKIIAKADELLHREKGMIV